MNAIYDFGPDLDSRDQALMGLLHDSHGVRPVYVLGHPSMASVATRYGARFHTVPDALQGRVLEDLWRASSPHSAWRTAADADAAAGLRAIVERYHGRAEDAVRRGMSAFDHWCGYWEWTLAATRADVVYSYASGHCIYSYALHAAARTVGARTLMLRDTSAPGVSFLSEAVYGGLDCGTDLPRDEDGDVALARVRAHVRRLTGDYATAKPGFMRRHASASTSPEGRALRRAWKFLGSGRVVPPSTGDPAVPAAGSLVAPPVLERSTRPSGGSSPRRAWQEIWTVVRKRRLVFAYEAATRATAGRLRSDYVYFPLHYQPERTTAPEAGRWVRLERMVLRCLEVLPQDWTLLIREHPLQLHARLQGENGRLPSFYRDLARRDGRISFARIDRDPFALMDGARGVMTATGTAGFEGLVRGVPVLCTRGAWYAGLPGTHRIDVDDELAGFAAAPIGRTQEQDARLEALLAAIERQATKLIPIEHASPADEARESPDVIALATAVARVLGAAAPARRVEPFAQDEQPGA